MKKRPRKRTFQTLRESLTAQAVEGRSAALPLNMAILIEGGKLARVRRQRANVARRVLKRMTLRELGTPRTLTLDYSDIRRLCGAALSDEANSARISSKRLVRLAERVLGGYVPTRAEAKSLAGCVLSQAKGRRK
jgi:hypothetical protein